MFCTLNSDKAPDPEMKNCCHSWAAVENKSRLISIFHRLKIFRPGWINLRFRGLLCFYCFVFFTAPVFFLKCTNTQKWVFQLQEMTCRINTTTRELLQTLRRVSNRRRVKRILSVWCLSLDCPSYETWKHYTTPDINLYHIMWPEQDLLSPSLNQELLDQTSKATFRYLKDWKIASTTHTHYYNLEYSLTVFTDPDEGETSAVCFAVTWLWGLILQLAAVQIWPHQDLQNAPKSRREFGEVVRCSRMEACCSGLDRQEPFGPQI